jgi:hypothetical protein
MSTMSVKELQSWLNQGSRRLEYHEGVGYVVTRGVEMRAFQSIDEVEPFYRTMFGQDQNGSQHNISPPDLRPYGSTERPEAIVGWTNRYDGGCDPAVGPLFWKILQQEWDGFDRIDYQAFERLFQRFRPWWRAPENSFYSSLPEQFQIYRGTDAGHPVGLSWTLDLRVAQEFALGHRGISNKKPTILCAAISIADVVLASNVRNESEVVLFAPPASVGVIPDGMGSKGRAAI